MKAAMRVACLSSNSAAGSDANPIVIMGFGPCFLFGPLGCLNNLNLIDSQEFNAPTFNPSVATTKF